MSSHAIDSKPVGILTCHGLENYKKDDYEIIEALRKKR